MKFLTYLYAISWFLTPTYAIAYDGISTVLPVMQRAGDANAKLWITTPSIVPPYQIHISDDGTTLTAPPRLVPDVMTTSTQDLDGIDVRFSIHVDATPGPRDVWIEDAEGLRVIRHAFTITTSASPLDTYQRAIRVEAVSRASPSYARPGEQINLWLVGQGFEPGSQVTFSREGIGAAVVNGQPLPTEVFLRSQGQNNELDGLQYFMQVGGPDQVQPGNVDIIVTNPDGSTATGFGLLEILPPGQTAPPPDPSKPVEAITGASPRAVFLGRNVSLWIWGTGFVEGAQVDFLTPDGRPVEGIRKYAPSEVVERSTSHPGFAGIRSFLLVDAMAQLGPVDVKITNPNGTSQIAPGLFSLVAANNGAMGSDGGYTPEEGGCPPQGTPIREIIDISPKEVVQGDSFELVISGYGFACGAAVSISGGGMQEVSPLVLQVGNDMVPSTLRWRLKALENARAGGRTISVINPDNASKVSEDALEVLPGAQLTGSPGCVQAMGLKAGLKSALFAGGIVLFLGMRRRESY